VTDRVGLVAGVDEAGRGPLAGPVMAAAVVLGTGNPIVGLADSKLLTARRRAVLADEIRTKATAWCVASASVEEIDRLNILQATLLAMQRAVKGLPVRVDLAMIDGNQRPALDCQTSLIIKGDRTVPAISAASILAKVDRDSLMLDLDREYPMYGFNVHKGYPTAAHLLALTQHGACPAHRKSFGPVKKVITKNI